MVATQIPRRGFSAKFILPVLVLLSTGAAGAGAAVSEQPVAHLARRLLEIPEENLNIARTAFALDTLLLSEVDAEAGLAQIRELAAKVEKLVGGRQDGVARIRAINTVLRDEGFGYDKTDMYGRRRLASSLTTLLKKRLGNCVSLPLLWYAIAEELGYPVFAVEVPQHFFLRYDDGTYRSNIEVTSGGSEYLDEHYVQDFEIPPAALRNGIYLRSLSKREYVAALIANMAGLFYGQSDIGTAELLARLALKHHPRSIVAIHQHAAALNAQAAMTLSFDSPIEERNEQKKQADNLVAQALKLSFGAARLGAARPIGKEYWVRIQNRRAGAAAEQSAKRLPAEPFDIAALFHQGGEPVRITMNMPREFYFNPVDDEGSCLATCATVCGPPPGNMCAAASVAKTQQMRKMRGGR